MCLQRSLLDHEIVFLANLNLRKFMLARNLYGVFA